MLPSHGNQALDVLCKVYVRQAETALIRFRHIWKTVKTSTNRCPIHKKTAHFLPEDFLNGRFCKPNSNRTILETASWNTQK